jgi:ketosteroid isomerase-like protein
LIDAERGFARMARDSGFHDAFVANIADSSILFRPRAVNGKQWLLAHPAPRGLSLLAWEPRWAEVSRSGDFGWTTGPFEFRPKGAADTVAGRGTFLTVWQRQSDGRWKVLMDGGAPGPPSWQMARDGWSAWSTPALTALAPPSTPEAERRPLLELDSLVGSSGSRSGLAAHLTDDARLYRDGRAPIVGADAVRRALAADTESWRSRPLDVMMSRSADLAFTHGLYEYRLQRDLPDETGSYVRIWRRTGTGDWRVVVDVSFPLE